MRLASLKPTIDAEESESSNESPATATNDAPDVSRRIAELTAQNFILRQRVDTLENLVTTFRREMSAVKHALGPWMQVSNPSRYHSTELPMSVQPATASTSGGDGTVGGEYSQPRYQPYNAASSLPSADSLAPYFPAEDEISTTYRASHQQHRRTLSGANHPPHAYEAYTPTHPLVAPLDLSTTLEGTLHGLRESVVGLATGVDALGRRQEIAMSNEATRMAEEVGSLRLNLQGLRMQVCE